MERRPKGAARPWRPSTSTTSVRLPRWAAATARAAATVVFPVPPLPVTTRSWARSSTSMGIRAIVAALVHSLPVRVVGPVARGDNGPAMHRLLRLLSLPCLTALLALGATLGVTSPAQAQGVPGGPTVEVFTLSGVLDRSLLGDLRGAVAGAERRGARALLIQLDSFGGLGTDPAEVQRVIADAKVPVGIWVGPRAAQAAGASLFLLAKADVVSSSRQARIGPALPAELGRGRDADAEASLFASSGLPAEVEHGTVDGARAQSLRLTAYQAES